MPVAPPRRLQPLLVDRQLRRWPRAIGAVPDDGDDRLARDEKRAVARNRGNDGCVRRHVHRRLAALVFEIEGAAVRAGRDLGDGRVGHAALGTLVPGTLTFAAAAERLGKDHDLEGLEVTVRLFERGRADKITGLEIADRQWAERPDLGVRPDLDRL